MANAQERMQAHRDTQRSLDPIPVGTCVFLQNPVSKEWDRTGKVVAALENRQYLVRLDSTGRMTKRNRIHMKIPWWRPSPTPVTPPDTTVIQRPRRDTRPPQRYIQEY